MLEELIDDKWLEKTDRIAVGVSGGADSMLLLWALIFKQKQIGFYLKVVNVNHHIRGEESDKDSKFVEDFCKKKNIDCEIVDIDVLKHKIESKKTLEQSARDLRYNAIYDVMKKDCLNKLFLAHHKNDQAETILMHILRGSGISGACGIKEKSGVIYRPLLRFSKNEILKLTQDYGISYVNDSSNNDNDYSRNYMRNIVIPDIEKIYPNAVQSIFEFGNKCLEIQNFIESFVDENLLVKTKSDCLIKGDVFEKPSFVAREYIKRTFEALGVYYDVEAKHYELVAELNSKQVGSQIDLPHSLIAKKTYAGVKIFKKHKISKVNAEYEFVLGEINVEGYGKIFAELVRSDDVVYGEGALYADYGKISTSAVWRFRRQGDVFSKLGTGSKKLNDYFTDKKIEFEKRDILPVLAVGNQILVVAENDISEKVKIEWETDMIVKLTFNANINS